MMLSRRDNRIIKPWKIFDNKFGDFLPYFGFYQRTARQQDNKICGLVNLLSRSLVDLLTNQTSFVRFAEPPPIRRKAKVL